MPGRIVIEDVADALHVEPARGNVAGDEDIDLALLETIQFLQAAGLVHVAMDFSAAETVALQALVQVAHRRLAVGEDDRGFDQIVGEQPAQRIGLAPRLGHHLEGGDVLIGAGRAADFDPLGIGEEFLRQLLNRRRHGGAEQQRLARIGKLGTDEFDVGNEPHVEHAVRFVDHEQFAPVQQDLAPLEQVHQPARRGDQHVDAFVQRLDLIAHLHAADQQRELQIMVLAVFLEIFSHLGGQFAGRRQDQAARHQRAAASGGHDIDHRKHETGGLAGTGLRDADDVLHHQDRRDRLGLDRGRLGITGGFDRIEEFFGKAEIGKGHAGPLRVRSVESGERVEKRGARERSARGAALGAKSPSSQEIAAVTRRRRPPPAATYRTGNISPPYATAADRDRRRAARPRWARNKSPNNSRAPNRTVRAAR